MFLKRIRVYQRPISLLMTVLFISTLLSPLSIQANTGGATQPEFGSFMDAGNMELVSPFTGDFSYNIPLLEIGGYPVNLSYNSGITMEQQASWVGLGWNLNIGEISRTVRGVPDDFDGESITEQNNRKTTTSYSVKVRVKPELLGLSFLKNLKVGSDFSINYSEDRGFYPAGGFTFDAGPFSAGVSNNPASGINFSPQVSITNDKIGGKLGLNASFNSRSGLQNIGISHSIRVEDQEKTNETDTENTSTQTQEKKKYLNGPTSSASMPIRSNHYFPYSKPTFNSTNTFIEVSTGIDIPPVSDVVLDLSANCTVQSLKSGEKNKSTLAYGFLYSQNQTSNSITDFNRDGDMGTFYPEMSFLPPAQNTYDILSINAQGMSGKIKPIRTHENFVSNPSYSTSASTSASLSIELGAAAASNKWGTDLSLSQNVQYSYNSHPFGANKFRYNNNPENTLELEWLYVDESEFRTANQAFATSVDIDEPSKLSDFETRDAKFSYQSTEYKNPRVKNLKSIRALRADIATHAAHSKNIVSYGKDSSLIAQPTLISRNGGFRKPHHISEYTITNENGEQYVFGLPAYNLKKVEKTFNVTTQDTTKDKLVDYVNGDNSENNTKGRDHFYTSKSIPAYVHSYLLTSKLGSDYIDVTNDGVTDDDLGSYVKFNYTQVANSTQPYKWRSVQGEYTASYMEGSKYLQNDNKASYTYGEKEVWYVHSIVSNDQIALFKISDRDDGLQVVDENGSIDDTNKILQKLDKIIVYDKDEYYENTANAIPIKTIHFEYEDIQNSLIPNTPNSILVGTNQRGGKLTLKKIYTTYRNSTDSSESTYTFAYNTQVNDTTVEYDTHLTDKWGNYKGKNPYSLKFSEYPYVNEELSDTLLNKYAALWNLEEITTPSKSKIKIKYESDRYGYVQDLKARKNFFIKGILLDDITPGLTQSQTDIQDMNSLYKSGSDKDFEENAKHFSLIIENPYAGQTSPDYSKLIPENRSIFFNVLSHINETFNPIAKDRVTGYAQIDTITEYGPNPNFLRVQLTPTDYNAKGDLINPIAKAVGDYIYQNHQNMIFGNLNANTSSTNYKKFVQNIGAMVDNIISLFYNTYQMLFFINKFGKRIEINKSWITLAHPTGAKFGGGHRVSQIEFTDDFSNITGEQSSTYGYTYDYTLEDGSCSGVASMEPMLGGDESPLNEPTYYSTQKVRKGKPNPSIVQVKPGDLFAPPATVGYSRVVQKDINYDSSRSSKKKTEHNFYTAKDFPIIRKHTDIEYIAPQGPVINFSNPFTGSYNYQIGKAYQGWLFKFNNMHGANKSTKIIVENSGEPETVVSESITYYRSKGKELINTAEVINGQGAKVSKLVGVNVESVIDHEHTGLSVETFDLNVNLYQTGLIIVPPVLPKVSSDIKEFDYAINTKIVEQKGLVDSVVTYTNGFKTKQVHEMYDELTGQAILSSLTTEYNAEKGAKDRVYTQSIPGYYVEENQRMGLASKNLNYVGKVEDQVTILTATQLQSASEEQLEVLKTVLYKAYVDGLKWNKFQDLYGNKAQMGVFIEGDEVYNYNDNKIYTVSEVLDQDDITTIQSVIPTAANFTLDPPTISAGVNQSQMYPTTQLFNDPSYQLAYLELLNACSDATFSSNGVPTNTNANQITSFLAAPTAETFYATVASGDNTNFLYLGRILAQHPKLKAFFSKTYENQDFIRRVNTLLNCPSSYDSLNVEVQNTKSLEYIKEIFKYEAQINYNAYLCKYADFDFIPYLDASSNSIASAQVKELLSLINVTPCPTLNKSTIYKALHNNSSIYYVSLFRLLTQEFYSFTPSSTVNSTTINSITSAVNIASLNSIISTGFPSDFHSNNKALIYRNSDCDCFIELGSSILDSDNCASVAATTVSLAPNASSYITPSISEVVVFVDEFGAIKNLNTNKIQIIRSGNRNLITSELGKITSVNTSIIEPLIGIGTVDGILSASFVDFNDEWIVEKEFDTNYSLFNPFKTGHRGQFRPKRTYTPKFERDYQSTIQNRNDGVLRNFEPLYTNPNAIVWNNYVLDQSALKSWVYDSKALSYSINGQLTESVNPIGLYSGMLMNKINMPYVKFANCRQNQVLVEDFEQYHQHGLIALNINSELNLTSTTLNNSFSHSGKSSLPVTSNGTEEFNLNVSAANIATNFKDNLNYYNQPFSLEQNKKYVIQGWIRSGYSNTNPNTINQNYANSTRIQLVYTLNNSTITHDVYAEEEMIDNWRPARKVVELPNGATNVKLRFIGGVYGGYFDDVRIFPLGAQIQSFVYDESTSRVVTTLDDNNYGTFYKYDYYGKMDKTIVESESGKITIQEKQVRNARQ